MYRADFALNITLGAQTNMLPVLRFKYVDVDAKKLTITQLRQLPPVSLCHSDGRQDESLSLVGTIRYKHDGVLLWALALQGNKIVRCPLDPKLRTQKYLEEQLEFWTRHAAMSHNQKTGEDSVAHSQVAKYRIEIAAEPGRFAAHSGAAGFEQIFL